MNKYAPSVKNNNQIKDELLQEMNALLYRIEKGKYNQNLDKNSVKEAYDSLFSAKKGISGIIFTGNEDLAEIKAKVNSHLSVFKKALEQDFNGRFCEATDDLLYYLDSFKAIADGDIDYIDEEETEIKKLSWSKRKLYARLDELKEIEMAFKEQENRLEKEIKGLEKDLAELDDKMLAEDNERLINDLYRKITSLKSKLDMLDVRKNNYSACFNLLDIIYANANEILAASQFSSEETSKAKALLNIDKLKSVINEPDKAISILKMMEKDVKSLSEKVKSVDEKVFGLDTKQTSVSSNALAYKEELMRKKREKDFNNEKLNELHNNTHEVSKKVTEDK